MYEQITLLVLEEKDFSKTNQDRYQQANFRKCAVCVELADAR